MAKESVTVYAGFDPTAPSLQVGNMVPLMALRRLQRRGHRPIVLVGGATGMIGDPSGKSEERNLLEKDDLLANAETVKAQLERFVDFEGGNGALLLNNADWIGPIGYLDWLRDVGKHFSVNAMMGKESVRKRLGEKEKGISYTEFSYMLLQAYDFLHLYREYGCRLQIGGGDQWGNITAGIELVRRMGGEPVFGFTLPLITTASGEKLGKSAGNSVWLDPARTSAYDFYQYWRRTEDEDVARFLKVFTELELDRIAELDESMKTAPEKREAQDALAEEVTRMIHGEDGLARARRASKILFGGVIEKMSDAELVEIFADVPSHAVARDRLAGGIGLLDLCVESGLFPSKGEAKRRVEGGGVYVNNERVTDRGHRITENDLASESVTVLRKGKKDYLLVRFQ